MALKFDITLFNQEGKEIFKYEDVQNTASNGRAVPDISFYIKQEGDDEDRYSQYISYTGFPFKVTNRYEPNSNTAA